MHVILTSRVNAADPLRGRSHSVEWALSAEEKMSAIVSENVLLRLSADIVATHVKHNPTPIEAIHEPILSIYAGLSKVGTSDQTIATIATPDPAVPIKKSVFPDFIICLGDGKTLKMLKRRLSSYYGMTLDLPGREPGRDRSQRRPGGGPNRAVPDEDRVRLL